MEKRKNVNQNISGPPTKKSHSEGTKSRSSSKSNDDKNGQLSDLTYLSSYTWTMATDTKSADWEIEIPRRQPEDSNDASLSPVLLEYDTDEDLPIGRSDVRPKAYYSSRNTPSKKLTDSRLKPKLCTGIERKPEYAVKKVDDWLSQDAEQNLDHHGLNAASHDLQVKNSTLLDSSKACHAEEILRNLNLSSVNERGTVCNSTLLDSSKARNAKENFAKLNLSTIHEPATRTNDNHAEDLEGNESTSLEQRWDEVTRRNKASKHEPRTSAKNATIGTVQDILKPVKLFGTSKNEKENSLKGKRVVQTSTPMRTTVEEGPKEEFSVSFSTVKSMDGSDGDLQVAQSHFVNSNEILTTSEPLLCEPVMDLSVEECCLFYETGVPQLVVKTGKKIDYREEIKGVFEDVLMLEDYSPFEVSHDCV